MCYDDSPMETTINNQKEKANAPEIEERNKLIKSTTSGGNQVHKKFYFSIFLHIDFFLVS